MVLRIDTREHESEMKRILPQFDKLGVSYYRKKLNVGDYMNIRNPRIVVDRKKDLQEISGNVCQDHIRFRKELERAQELGIHLIILCEHGGQIKSLEDVLFWDNPRRHLRIKKNGVWTTQETKAITGEKLYKILDTMRKKYGVEFLFCDKRQTAQRIVELLK